jgi:hypothetical protein
MQSCYQVCQQTCAKQQVVVNGEACKSYGTWVAGPAEAKKACELTMVSWTQPSCCCCCCCCCCCGCGC